jgi:hypothetical protein
MNFNVYTATTEEFELEFMRLMTKTVKELNQICKDNGMKMYHHRNKFKKCCMILFPSTDSRRPGYNYDVDWQGIFDRYIETFFWKKQMKKSRIK